MASNTFAIIVSGRLVQTDFQQVEGGKFLITIPEADNINHLVVFMTGSMPLPDGMAGAVYFSFPDPLAPPTWFYLGYISNQKPSAIFKITKLKQIATNGNMITDQGMGFGFTQPIISHVAQIGISIEPQNSVLQLTSADPSVNTETGSTSQMSKFEIFTNKAAENLFNYCSSFANSALYFVNNAPNQQLVPLATINDWYQRFMRNIKQNPNFWKL